MTLDPIYIEKLIAIAKVKTWEDRDKEAGEHFNAYDWSGGNYDDTYAGGVKTGTVEMARQVLDMLGVAY